MVFVSYQEENEVDDVAEFIDEGESCLDCLEKHPLNENANGININGLYFINNV